MANLCARCSGCGGDCGCGGGGRRGDVGGGGVRWATGRRPVVCTARMTVPVACRVDFVHEGLRGGDSCLPT